MSQPAPHQHHGIDYVELTVTDVAKAKAFYSAAFGWQFNDYGPGYAGIRGVDREVGGLVQGAAVTRGGRRHQQRAIHFPRWAALSFQRPERQRARGVGRTLTLRCFRFLRGLWFRLGRHARVGLRHQLFDELGVDFRQAHAQ